MDGATLSTLARVSGWLLVAPLIILVGASIVPARAWSAPVEEHLRLVAAHRSAWIVGNVLFLVAAVVTTAALGLLTLVLFAAGQRVLAPVGLLLFVPGVALWMASLAFRLSATVWAAQVPVVPPAGFEPLRHWATMLYSAYMALAFLAVASYGGAIAASGVLAPWLGWATALLGCLGAASFVVGSPKVPGWGFSIADLPAWIHVLLLPTGIGLLLRR